MPLRRKNVSTETGKLGDHEVMLTNRTRYSAAELVLSPGVVFLPATSRGRYRLVDLVMIAIGGAAAGATSINIYGVISGVKTALHTGAVASLTQNAGYRMGGPAAAANGGSFAPLDMNTPVTVERIGSAMTGATHIDVVAMYALESASMSSGL